MKPSLNFSFAAVVFVVVILKHFLIVKNILVAITELRVELSFLLVPFDLVI